MLDLAACGGAVVFDLMCVLWMHATQPQVMARYHMPTGRGIIPPRHELGVNKNTVYLISHSSVLQCTPRVKRHGLNTCTPYKAI